MIGSVLFGSLVVTGPGPEALAKGFGHSAILAILVSVGLSAAALLLVFALPRRVDRRG